MSRSMLILIGLVLPALTTGQVASPTTGCQDVDTQSCISFHASRPHLCDDPTFSQDMCKRHCGNCPLECYSCDHPVSHPEDCNTTKACGPSMQCVTRHLLAADGHHEYLLSCEAKELCDLVSGNFGKRDLELSGEERQRHGRDVVMTCCHGDLCNAGIQAMNTTAQTGKPAPSTAAAVVTTKTTTTTSRTTTVETVPTSGPDSGCSKNIVIAMQNQISRANHAVHYSPREWLPFVDQLTSQLHVAPNATHVAAVTFNNYYATVQWQLDRYNTTPEVRSAFAHLGKQQRFVLHGDFPFGSGQGLSQLRRVMLSGNHSIPNGDAVLVLEYNGFSSKYAHVTPAEVVSQQAAGNKVILVSVWGDADTHHYTSNYDYIFRVSSASSLPQLIPRIVNLLCPQSQSHAGVQILG